MKHELQVIHPVELSDKNEQGETATLLAEKLFATLSSGARIDPKTMEKLFLAIRQKMTTIETKSDADEERKQKILQRLESFKVFLNEENPERTDRIAELALSLAFDMDFFVFFGKAPGSRDDFSGVSIFDNLTNRDYKKLGEEIDSNLKERKFPNTAILQGKNRAMLICDIPSSPKWQLIIYNPNTKKIRDADRRETDGFSKIFFCIKKDNPILGLLKKSELQPKDFADAAIRAGLANSKIENVAKQLLPRVKGSGQKTFITDCGSEPQTVTILDEYNESASRPKKLESVSTSATEAETISDLVQRYTDLPDRDKRQMVTNEAASELGEMSRDRYRDLLNFIRK